MGGTWSVKVGDSIEVQRRVDVFGEVSDLLRTLDAEMSIYKPDSDVSRFNAAETTEWFPVAPEVAEVVAAALRASEESGGAFDVTVAPLVNLWGFGPAKSGGQVGQVPTDERIAAARSHVGYRLLECRADPPALRKRDPRLSIDLGGIGKGFAADKVGACLERRGFSNYLVAVGGELRARGSSREGPGWRVGIETPTPDTRRILRQVVLRDASLSTSGDYRNFFEIAGKRFCHEIDPCTGRPIEGGPASVSVLHASGAYADAMATAMMVLGADEGTALARRLGLSVHFVTRGGGAFETKSTGALAD
jgi:thiamine biosynthesis lipoprotein